MKKILSIFLLAIMIITSLVPTKVYASDDKKVILIDPGHGGIDGGAKSKGGAVEKDINLQISLKLKAILEQNGYIVYMTREEDKGLEESGNTIKEKKREDLNKRRDMKIETKCDLFISIHQNMFPQSKCFGAQVWHSSNEISKKLADNIQESLKTVIDDGNKRVSKPAGDAYLILRDKAECASVLVECGFLSNSSEEQKLQTDGHQCLIVDGIFKGIEEYFKGSI